MSTYAEDAAGFSSLFHSIWSTVLELSIGTYLLADEMGWACIAPPLVVIGELSTNPIAACSSRNSSRRAKNCDSSDISYRSIYLTEDINERYMAFSQANQTRISATKAVLDSMKNIKMTGLMEKTESRLQSSRENELEEFNGLYRLMVAFSCSCK